MSIMFNINEGVLDDDNEVGYDMDSVQEETMEFDDEVLGSLSIALHMESNYTKLTEAIGIMELEAVAAGEDPTRLYETSDILNESKASERITAFFKGAKAFIVKWAGYIKGFFSKIFHMLESVFATNKKFVKDNKELLQKTDLSKVGDFKGFKYTIPNHLPDILFAINKTSNLPAGAGGARGPEENEIESLARTTISGTHEKLTSDSEMRKAMYKKFRDNRSEPTSMSVEQCYGNISTLISIIEGGKAAKDTANKDYDAAKKSIKRALDNLSSLEKELKSSNKNNSNDKAIQFASKAHSVLKNLLKTENAAHAEHIKALRSEVAQARSVAGKIITHGTSIKGGDYKKIKESVTGSAIDSLANLEF